MSMLSSSAFSYQDGFSQENALNFAASYLQQQQQQQQQQRQEQQKQTLDSSVHPSSLSPLSSESNMSPTNPFQHHQISSPTDYSQYAQQQQYVGRHALSNDAPSPEGFQTLEMAGSFDPYLPPNSRVPTGIRQALGDASKIFEFQAKAGLLDDESSMFDNSQQPQQHPQQRQAFSQHNYS
ncbi:hypothetical protein CPC16_005373 [Podila verticillata]|nr:hypothetical protein CPC16_005373 [Podila verticillata]